MTPRAVEEKQSNQRTEEASDFPETSDCCDFGYVLVAPTDAPAPARTTNTQPAE